MAFPVIPAALTTASLLGSLFANRGSGKTDKNIDSIIQQLLGQSKTGLPEEVKTALLSQGSRNIGQQGSLAREQIRRNLARQGFGNSTVASDYENSLFRQGVDAQNALSERVTMADNSFKQQALQQALSALFGKKGNDIATQPDFGTPLAMGIQGLMDSYGKKG